MDLKTALVLTAALLLAVGLAVKVFAAPLKLLGRVAANTLLGLAALGIVNATSAVTGLQLGLNLFNAAVVGVLGVPGLGLLLLARWVLGA